MNLPDEKGKNKQENKINVHFELVKLLDHIYFCKVTNIKKIFIKGECKMFKI